jgi:hypothetical protein
MEITLRIPDDVAKRLSAAGGDLTRRALERSPRTRGLSRPNSYPLPDFGDAGPFPSRDGRLLGTTSRPSIRD